MSFRVVVAARLYRGVDTCWYLSEYRSKAPYINGEWEINVPIPAPEPAFQRVEFMLGRVSLRPGGSEILLADARDDIFIYQHIRSHPASRIVIGRILTAVFTQINGKDLVLFVTDSCLHMFDLERRLSPWAMRSSTQLDQLSCLRTKKRTIFRRRSYLHLRHLFIKYVNTTPANIPAKCHHLGWQNS